jgi:hypothetical protein
MAGRRADTTQITTGQSSELRAASAATARLLTSFGRRRSIHAEGPSSSSVCPPLRSARSTSTRATFPATRVRPARSRVSMRPTGSRRTTMPRSVALCRRLRACPRESTDRLIPSHPFDSAVGFAPTCRASWPVVAAPLHDPSDGKVLHPPPAAHDPRRRYRPLPGVRHRPPHL